MPKNKRNNRYKYQSNKPQSQSQNNNYQPGGPAEEILQEVIEIRELIEKSKQMLRQSQHQFGYLLSSKWFGAWKSYTGYDALLKDQNPEQSKGFGKKKPTSKINEDLLAKPNNKFVKVPQSLLQYAYLNYPVDDDCESEKDYIVIDQQLWAALQAKYPNAICIRRPLRKRKNGQPFVDVVMHSFNFVIVNSDILLKAQSLTQAEYQKVLKRGKKDETLENIFQIKRIRVPSIWNLQLMRKFLKQFIPTYTDSKEPEKIEFWRMQNYLSFQEIRQNLCAHARGLDEGILGNSLQFQEKQQKDLDDFLKQQAILLVYCGQMELKRMAPPENPSGYCQECIQEKSLTFTCQCKQVFYCSSKCLYDDKLFHFRTCSVAYDSDDDKQYKKKSMFVGTQEVKCGLANLGNTCYMNSSLQCLCNLQWLYEYFSSNKYSKLISKQQIDQNKGIFIHKFAKFVKKLNQSEVYSPYSLKAQISYFITPFKGYAQHDSNDFIIYLLNTLNDFTVKESDSAFGSFIHDNLAGKFSSSVTCPQCKLKSATEDVYLQVSLPIKSKVQEKQIQYVRVLNWDSYEKGTILVTNWKEICSQIGESIDCRRFVGTEGGDLKEITEEAAEEIYKKHKRENLVFYSYLKPTLNTIQIKLNLSYSRLIAGNQMKSPYGYPIITQIDPSIKLWNVYKIVAEMINAEKEALDEIEELRIKIEQQIKDYSQTFAEEKKKQYEKSQSEATESAENESEQKQKKQYEDAKQLKEGISKIEQKWNEQLFELRYKIKFRLVLVTGRKGKKLCHYCNKKCSLCSLPFSTTTSLIEFSKLGESNLEIDILLDSKIDIAQTHSKSSTYNQFTTLEECLEEFSMPQQLDEENAWYCEVCDMMQLAQKQLRICEYPKTMIIQLKRFKQQNGKKVKNNEVVWYPEELFIKEQELKYRLSGIVVHEGSLDGGHYWAVCRKGDEYYLFNDDEVKKVGDYFQKGAYILVYEMI